MTNAKQVKFFAAAKTVFSLVAAVSILSLALQVNNLQAKVTENHVSALGASNARHNHLFGGGLQRSCANVEVIPTIDIAGR